MGTKTGWGFQLNWQEAVKTWISPKDHAKRMIDRFIALSRSQGSATSALPRVLA